jgi:hypothetical protein
VSAPITADTPYFAAITLIAVNGSTGGSLVNGHRADEPFPAIEGAAQPVTSARLVPILMVLSHCVAVAGAGW